MGSKVWRAFFLALGINLLLLGCQCLVVEKVVLKDPNTNVANSERLANSNPYGGSFYNASFPRSGLNGSLRNRVFKPRDWMPWSLLAAGAVLVIYTVSLPKRAGGSG